MSVSGFYWVAGAISIPLVKLPPPWRRPTQIQGYLLELLQRVILPGREVPVERWWSGIMGVGAVKEPIVREWNAHVAVAVRLGAAWALPWALPSEKKQRSCYSRVRSFLSCCRIPDFHLCF
jgi:hypothetical protein